MKILDTFQLVGEFSVYKVYGDSKELFYKEKNLITKVAKQFILSGIYTAGVVSDPITSLHAGTGGCIDPQSLYPKLEDPLQTGLSTPLITIPVISVVDNASIQVTFLADIDQAQANNQLINEAGLFKASGLIFNIKNHPGITKTSDFSIHYEWVIKLL